MKKGFTLMEVLAVLMLIALVTSFAVPIYRSARAEMRYNQARAAAMRIAEAMRTFYQQTKGFKIAENNFNGLTGQSVIFSNTCEEEPTSGVPSHSSKYKVHVSNLFGCGYLSRKDFAGLPFEFYICDPQGESSNCGNNSNWFVRVQGLADSGKYEGKYFHITREMQFVEESAL